MDELSKIKRVMEKVVPEAPRRCLVLDGSTGQNAYEQARQFSAATQVTDLAVTKLDGHGQGRCCDRYQRSVPSPGEVYRTG